MQISANNSNIDTLDQLQLVCFAYYRLTLRVLLYRSIAWYSNEVHSIIEKKAK